MISRFDYDKNYRERLNKPLQDLAEELHNVGDKSMNDSELVKLATKKIRELKKLLLSCNMSENILNAIMKE